ncbi:hypothetical protein ABZ876_15180 [Streptomyces sp. NPDC046931]|uniref:hypothetical protein n=1 Tax=Streptomyces sp. NPDC046931 TaxID=3154806 RepID=UPI0033F27A31
MSRLISDTEPLSGVAPRLRGPVQPRRAWWFPGVLADRPTLANRVLTTYVRRMTRMAADSYRASPAMWDVTRLQKDGSGLLRPSLLPATLSGPVLPPLAGPPPTPAERAILHGLDRVGSPSRR